MDERPIAKNFKVTPFLWLPVPETWEPDQRDDESPAIHQVHGQSFRIHGYILRSGLFCLNGKRIHTSSPEAASWGLGTGQV